MNTTSAEPATLIEAVTYFADEDKAVAYVAERRWPDGVTCPHCGCKSVSFIKTRRIWQCKDKECGEQFSVKVGSVMEDSPIPVGKWMVAFWLTANAKNSVSSCEIARALGVTQKSAWFMLQRIHLAMQEAGGGKLMGQIEVDETYIGGKARFMHRDRREKVLNGGKGSVGKSVVMGILERPHNEKSHSKVRAKVVSGTKRRDLVPVIKENVEISSAIYSDAHSAYDGLQGDFTHKFIDHAKTYVDGAVHTNGLENFWSLFKRCIKGTHVSIEPFHLFRYVDGEAFRFNNRKANDGERLNRAVDGIAGKRLTYRKLIGDNSECPPQP